MTERVEGIEAKGTTVMIVYDKDRKICVRKYLTIRLSPLASQAAIRSSASAMAIIRSSDFDSKLHCASLEGQ